MSDASREAPEPRRRHFRYDPTKVRGDEVYRDARRHSGVVRWLKIVLPALAGWALDLTGAADAAMLVGAAATASAIGVLLLLRALQARFAMAARQGAA